MPDDEMLILWVEDELEGESAAAVNAWAAAQPEWLARREEARQVKSLLKALPASEEPPYADFFNSRIAREISREAAAASPAGAAAPSVASSPGWLWRWFLPTTAVAGMALCFWAGTRVVPVNGHAPTPVAVSTPVPTPVLYTPERGVSAAYFGNSAADAMVIVLDGVAAIPDSFELPETAAIPEEPATTAELESGQ